MKAPERIYRTAGGRLVRQGDPEAAYLAYPVGADIPEVHAKELGLKEASKPADKAARKTANKSHQRQPKQE